MIDVNIIKKLFFFLDTSLLKTPKTMKRATDHHSTKWKNLDTKTFLRTKLMRMIRLYGAHFDKRRKRKKAPVVAIDQKAIENKFVINAFLLSYLLWPLRGSIKTKAKSNEIRNDL